jgi:hypothetical protein
MCAGYIVDNLGSPGIEETREKKIILLHLPFIGGRLTDKLIEKLGLLHKLSLCHTPIKPDLLGFPRINVFVCRLLDHVFKRFTPFWYQSFAPLIMLYPFISYIFVFTFHINFSLCCFCLGSDLVSNQSQSDCLLPTLFLVSCEPLKHAVKQPTRKDTKLY